MWRDRICYSRYTGTGKVVFTTESKKCIPSDESIRQMLSAGYKVLLDGKAYKPQKKDVRR